MPVTVLMGLTTRLRLARLQLVTDTRGGGRAFGDYCATVFQSGVDLLMVREPGLAAGPLTEALAMARSVAIQLNKLVVVYHDVAVAKEFGADVLQLGAVGSEATAAAKAAQHEYALIGTATHDEAGLTAALADVAVSYVTVGPVFGGSHPRHRLPGLEFVRQATQQVPVADSASKPWFAIGGVTQQTLTEVLDAGARRVVLTQGAIGTQDPAEVVTAVSGTLRDAWQADPSLDGYALSVFGGLGATLQQP